MPHSKPHATLFSSDELVEPRKIGNQVVSDKRIKSTLVIKFRGTNRIVYVMPLVPEYVSGENEKLANNKFIFSSWLIGFRLVNNLHP